MTLTRKQQQQAERRDDRHDKTFDAVGFWSCTGYLEAVGGEGVDNLWRDVQAWRARQREVAVQISATHSLIHQPVNQRIANQQAEHLYGFRVCQHTEPIIIISFRLTVY